MKNVARPLRIAIDGTCLYGRYGGVAYALWNLLAALAAEEDENFYTVFAPSDGFSRAQRRQLGPRFRCVRLRFSGSDKIRRIAWQQLQLPRVLARGGFDVFHAPTYVAPLLSRTPLVLTVYDLIALDAPHFATLSNRLHYRAFLERSIRHASRVIVPSESVRDAILRRGLAGESDLRVVSLGVEARFFAADDNAKNRVRKRYDLPEKYLLFVGNFEPKKNLQTVLRALEMLPNAPLLILAGGARAWKNEARMLCENPRVRDIGYIARTDLPALYAMCEAFLFPSLAEGFGLPVLEALAAGAPTLASTRVPIPNLENAALVCEPNDARAFSSQLQKLLSDENLRADLRQRGPQLARTFPWRRAAQETLRIYREAAAADK